MPEIKTDDIMTYYEIYGEGNPLVFIHGGFVISDAGHTSNLENPEEFNKALEKFLKGVGL